MAKERFQIWDSTNVMTRLFTNYTDATVKDTVTGNKAEASGKNFEEAKTRAWEKLEKIQGPPPSKK